VTTERAAFDNLADIWNPSGFIAASQPILAWLVPLHKAAIAMRSRLSTLLVAALAAAGFGLTLAVFYPGLLTVGGTIRGAPRESVRFQRLRGLCRAKLQTREERHELPQRKVPALN
jgi:hypothetical protein